MSLKTDYFLYAVVFDVDTNLQPSKGNLLKWCANLVILDESEDLVRFAHLSVHDYLEKMQKHASSLNHASAAETCIFL